MKTNWRSRQGLLAILVLITISSAAWGAAYRWTDASGNVQYGDQPPAGVQAQRLRAPSPPPLVDPDADAPAQPTVETAQGAAPASNPSDAATGTQGQEAPSPEALARDAQRRAEEQRQQAQVRQRNCQAARNNLEMLQQNRPLRLKQEGSSKGRKVSATEREQAMREARRQIRENCN